MAEGDSPLMLSYLFRRLSNRRVRDVIELIRRRGHTLSGISRKLGIRAPMASTYMKELRLLGIVDKRTVKGSARFRLRNREVLKLLRVGKSITGELEVEPPKAERPQNRRGSSPSAS